MEVGKVNLINDLFDDEKNRFIIPVYNAITTGKKKTLEDFLMI